MYWQGIANQRQDNFNIPRGRLSAPPVPVRYSADVNFTRCWEVLQGAGRCDKVLGGVTRCWEVLQSVGRCYKVMRGVTKCCQVYLLSVVSFRAEDHFSALPISLYLIKSNPKSQAGPQHLVTPPNTL